MQGVEEQWNLCKKYDLDKFHIRAKIPLQYTLKVRFDF